MKNMEAAVFALRLQQNESGVYEELFTRLWDMVYRCTFKKLQNIEDANDAAQDVFMNIYEKIDTLRNPHAFNKWLSFLIRSACQKYIRSQYHICNDFSEIDSVVDGSIEHQPEAWAEREEMRDSIHRCVAMLPAEQGTIISLRYLEDYPPNQISRITRRSVSQTHRDIEQGQNRLRELLESSVFSSDICATVV